MRDTEVKCDRKRHKINSQIGNGGERERTQGERQHERGRETGTERNTLGDTEVKCERKRQRQSDR